ncbi:MAG: ATP-binding protein [Candidatus Krumholzibacteria bacterium]|nr:ATP-binding protein [Candidatus Krumholzibacteria bacterium]
MRWGKVPAVATAILGVLSFDFFLVPPYLAFRVEDVQYVFTLFGLLAAGLVVGTLASRMREQAIQARKGEAQTAALYRLAADLADSAGFEEVLQAIRKNVKQIVNCGVAIYLPVGGVLELATGDPGFPANEPEKGIASWAYENGSMAGGGPDEATRRKTRYLPFKTPQGVIGVLGLHLRKGAEGLSQDEEGLLNALVSQGAIAIQRANLAEQSRRMELMQQTEKLQSALLSSISHDLRTPLVSITGTLTTLQENDPGLDDATRKELIENASEEADRLNRIVGNLLDLTKMEAGTLRISKRPCDLRDVLGASLEQLRERIGDRAIRMAIPRDFPEVPMDFSFMMKVFFNLLDNAIKYSPEDSPIDVGARVHRTAAEIEVGDRGTGIAEGDLTRIFERFYRAEKAQPVAGTGLGLSICKGIIEAHGGRIVARNNADSGATFIVTLPLEEKQEPS